MDPTTVNHYSATADERSAAYESVDVSGMHELMLRYFDPGARLLEIGCGSGRDAAFLVAQGRDVTATDASTAMLDAAGRCHPELSGRLINAPLPLPSGHELLQSTFDGIYSVAVLMHVPDEDLFEFAFQIKSMLRAGGALLLSFSTGRAGLSDNRDTSGRLFRERPVGEVQLLFERLGFRLLAHHRNDDGMGRQIPWHTLVLRLADATGNGPVDQIETIINRDRKDATYKLALLRALCDIAQTEYRQAVWGNDDTVSVPLGLVAEKWLFYYWPIVEADLGLPAGEVAIPQKRGREINKPLAFRRHLRELIAHCCCGRGGLDTFYADFRNGHLPTEIAVLADAALNEIAHTIVVGPVTFAGGAIDDDRRFFWQDGRRRHKGHCTSSRELVASLGRIHMRGEIWRELALLGHWISEAIVLRWGELTQEISQERVTIAQAVGRLLIVPETERDQQRVRGIYGGLSDLQCVWTADAIGPKRGFEIDHIMPFSLWHNNDLWNLMPATRKANHAKRDRLVSRQCLFDSRGRIIDYWQATRESAPNRFDYELRRSLLGASFRKGNWEAAAFNALAEAIESLACQRGIPRWPKLRRDAISLAIPATECDGRPDTTLGNVENPVALPSCADATDGWRLLPWEDAKEKAFVSALPVVADLAAGVPYDGFRSRTLDAEQWAEVPEHYAAKSNFVVKVDGDSMEPTLSDGDYVVCEWHRTPRRPGQVVIMGAFESGGEGGDFALKRFEESATHWRFHSDNPAVGDPDPVPKIDVPGYPILGIALYNLTRDEVVR